MNGNLDEFGRALVAIRLQAATTSEPMELQAWIDTGFTGEPVLSQRHIERSDVPRKIEAVPDASFDRDGRALLRKDEKRDRDSRTPNWFFC